MSPLTGLDRRLSSAYGPSPSSPFISWGASPRGPSVPRHFLFAPSTIQHYTSSSSRCLPCLHCIYYASMPRLRVRCNAPIPSSTVFQLTIAPKRHRLCHLPFDQPQIRLRSKTTRHSSMPNSVPADIPARTSSQTQTALAAPHDNTPYHLRLGFDMTTTT